MTTSTDAPARPHDETSLMTARGEHEQSRARYPDETGFIERDGVRVFWESYGRGRPDGALPSDLVTRAFADLEGADPLLRPALPGPLASTRAATAAPTGPQKPSAYDESEFMQDALDVMDACGVDGAICVGLSTGAQRAMLLAAEHPGAGGGDRLHRPLRLGQPPGRAAACAHVRCFWV